MSYPIYPSGGPGAPHHVEGTPGTRHVPDAPPSSRPYPTFGEVPGTDKCPPHVPASTGTSLHGEPQAGKHVNPYPVHGLQYALDSAMAAPKDVMHFQAGNIRGSADASGGARISEKPGNVAAVSAALDKAAAGRVAGARAGNQTSAFKKAAKGKKPGGPARDMQLRHFGTQADVNSATSQY